MKILITGGAGFLGQKLCAYLLDTITDVNIILSDLNLSESGFIDHQHVAHVAGDFTNDSVVRQLCNLEPDVVYHLAAVVSGQAEQDFDTGMRVNFYGTIKLLERLRANVTTPRFIFSSSVAVYGGDLPTVCTDATTAVPRNSYGAQKAACEVLINDFSRKGYVEGISLRLPTVAIRPGKPNAAASSFASGIIREPLNGQTAICPVDADSALWLTSPKMAIQNLAHAMQLDYKTLNGSSTVTLPGITASVTNMLDELENKTTKTTRELVRFQPDPFIQQIVNGWPSCFDLKRCFDLGFEGDNEFGEFIEQYMTDKK